MELDNIRLFQKKIEIWEFYQFYQFYPFYPKRICQMYMQGSSDSAT